MRPDLILESEGRRIILDTKFYTSGGLYAHPGARLDSSNLYQVFAYVMNRQKTHPEGPSHEGILLYPTVGAETRVDFTAHGLRFQARSVDLSRDWPAIHESMLSILE